MTPAVSNPSRRAFLGRLLPARAVSSPATDKPQPLAVAPPQVAIIAGRHCLAYQHSFCTVCRERCPIPGAVVIERGFPRIDPALCNGCRICHEVCPAPTNAIRLFPRPNSFPARAAIGSTAPCSVSHV